MKDFKIKHIWIDLQYALRLQKIMTYQTLKTIVLAVFSLLSLTTMFMLMVDDVIPALSRLVMLCICNICLAICTIGLFKRD